MATGRNAAKIYKDVGEVELGGQGMGYSAHGAGGLFLSVEHGWEIVRVEERGITPVAIFYTGHDVSARVHLAQWDTNTFAKLFPAIASGTTVTFDISTKPAGTRVDTDAALYAAFYWRGLNWRLAADIAAVRVLSSKDDPIRMTIQPEVENKLILECQFMPNSSGIIAVLSQP